MSTTRVTANETSAELDSLVPIRSATRGLALALTIALVLAAAWGSPAVVRPTLHSASSHAGAAVELATSDQLLTVAQVEPRAWPSATLSAVNDVPGAEVNAAWLLPAHADPALHGGADDVQGDALALLRAAYPDDDIRDDGNLPRSFASGETLHLVILWDVVDCAGLDPQSALTADIRTAFGTARSPDALWDTNSPAAYLDNSGPTSALCGRS